MRVNTDIYTKLGEEFGLSISDSLNAIKTKSVTITSVDDENAYVTIYEDDEPLPVPLKFLNIGEGYFKVLPTVGSLAVIGFLNGNEDAPFFITFSQIDTVLIIKGTTEININLDPDDDTKDSVFIKTGESTLKMDTNVIEFNGGGLDGLVKINELTDKLNNFIREFNAHYHMIPSGSFLISATAGVPNPQPVPVQTPFQNASNFVADDYKNTKITQG